MPYRQRGSFGRRRFGIRPVINSIKNIHDDTQAISSSKVETNLAKAVTSPSPTVDSDVSHGCILKAIWVSMDVCGTAASGVNNVFDAYMAKNPGANLTLPAPTSVGTSNEKKFIFKQWRGMIMATSDGISPYHWEGWIRIPKRYQRMGTDDTIVFAIACLAGVAGLYQIQAIYKWYT